MAKKRQTMEQKLGRWTDQANLTRESTAAPQSEANREEYAVARSLMTRLTEVAAAHHMGQNELIGYLLSWSLDEVERGAHRIERFTEEKTQG